MCNMYILYEYIHRQVLDCKKPRHLVLHTYPTKTTSKAVALECLPEVVIGRIGF